MDLYKRQEWTQCDEAWVGLLGATSGFLHELLVPAGHSGPRPSQALS